MAKLIIFRHGETEWNKQKLMTGQAEVPLTERGIEQAKDAGRALDGIVVFDKVFSSTLSRAFNTACLALGSSNDNRHLADKVEQRALLVERHTGDFTGRNHKTDPEIKGWTRNDYETRLPNGESARDVVERVTKIYEEELLPLLKEGKDVLVVAHAGVCRAFEVVLGIKPKEQTMEGSIPNATPLVVEFEDGKITGIYCLITKGARDMKKRNSAGPSV